MGMPLSHKSETDVYQFLSAFGQGWITPMSGIGGVLLSLLALSLDNLHQRRLWVILAVCCGLFSAYRVWRTERLRYITERDKNIIPRFEGEISELRFEPYPPITVRDEIVHRLGTTVTFSLTWVNKSHAPAAVKNISLLLADKEGNILRDGQVHFWTSIQLFTFPTPLYSYGESCKIRVQSMFDGVGPQQVDFGSLKVRLVDTVTSEDHLISCKPTEARL